MTTKTTHTPGPWRYEEGTKTIRAVPSNYWLASMNSWDGAVDHDANARLIAAAPELLAVAQMAANFGDNSLKTDILKALRPHERESFIVFVEAARAAIRAARGDA